MKKWIFAVATYLALNCITFGQTPFYDYAYGTMTVNDTLTVKSIQFTLRIDDLERFEDEWAEGLEGLAEDMEKDENSLYATMLEIPAESEHYYDAYSRFVDLHDSVMIQLVFKDSTGFVWKERSVAFASLERASKLYITRIYKEYRSEDLEEAEEALEDAEDKVEEIKDEISSKEKDILEKKQEIEANTNSISINRQTLSALIDQIGQQRQALARLPAEETAKRERAQREISRLEDERKEHEGEIRELSEDNFDLEKEIADLNFEISAEKQSLQAAMIELENARKAYNELDAEVLSYRVD